MAGDWPGSKPKPQDLFPLLLFCWGCLKMRASFRVKGYAEGVDGFGASGL